MKTKTKPLIRLLYLWVAICSFTAVKAQVTLQVYDSTYASCNNDGRINVYASGGTGPYTYTLIGAYGTVFGPVTQTGPNFTGLPQGYYNIIVSDVNGVNNSAQPAYGYINPTFYSYINVIPAICPASTGAEYVQAYNYNGVQTTYSYLWSNGASTDTISNLPVGNHYQCTVTDASSGCISQATDSGGVYQTSNITGTFTTTAANCNNGTATVTPANGVAPYTYFWSTGQTTANATGLFTGYSTVTITDAQLCSAVAYVSIQQAITINTNINTTAERCNAGDGTLTITATNGTAPFTYLWSSGQTDAHIVGLSAGYYDVTVTDHKGCTAVNYGQVQKSTPIVLTTSATTTVCTSPTGTATVNATGGTAPYTYVWNCIPAQATATATGLAAGYYVVTVVDALGCEQNQSAIVSNNTNLSLSLQATPAMCSGAPGGVTASVSGGSTPYTLLWNTGATSYSVSSAQGGYYSCEVTDHLGCKLSKYTYVDYLSPISVSVSPTDASCIYTADGHATVNIAGGTSPYTISWSNGQTGPSASGLLQGYYGVNVSDAHGCTGWNVFQIGYASVLPCSVQLTGTVYDDFDANCAVNGPDAPLQGVWIGCLPDGGYQWTTNGYFDFVLPPGTYSLYQAPPIYHTVICPIAVPTATLTAGQISANNDFFDKPDTLRDLSINCIPVNLPQAGFTQHLQIFVNNLGNITQTPDVVYLHALDINFLSSSPAPDIYDPVTHKLTWMGPSLTSTGTNVIDMYFGIPQSLPQGHILNNSDTVFPLVNDVDTFNNFEDVQGIVVGSYDPNFIEVKPKGTGAPGYISTSTSDTTLRYIVHFQNTGTAAATYVTLKIPVDANLDISTFHLIGASHRISSIAADKNRLLTISFNNISLPDSSVDRLGSQGFAAFTFRQKKGLHSYATINEQANIYFDFNTPVATNTTLNTIEHSTGIAEAAPGSLALYPNPTEGNVTLDLSALDESRVQVRVYDMMGRMAMELPSGDIPASKKLNLSTSGLATGVYTVEVMGSVNYVSKLVKTAK